jgi:hypothetical protein
MLKQYYPSFYTKWILSISFEMERIFLKRIHSHFIEFKSKNSYNYRASPEVTIA